MFNPFAAICAMLLSLPLLADNQTSCRVNITTQPEGASVIVDGRDRGTTPASEAD